MRTNNSKSIKYSKGIKNNQKNEIILNDKVRNEFQKHAEEIYFEDVPESCKLIEIAYDLMPILREDKSLDEATQRIKKGELPYLSYKHLPYDKGEISPPVDGKRPSSKKTWVSELVTLVILLMSGYRPFSFREEKGEELIHQIAPVPGKEQTRSNSGIKSLGFHTDDAILPKVFRPDVLFLTGLINEDLLPTYISLAEEAFNNLSIQDRKLLMGNNYRIETPDSFDDALKGMKIQSAWKPIVTIDQDGIVRASGNLYAVKCQDGNKAAQKALQLFQSQLFASETQVTLTKGTAIQFDNARCFHRRGELSKGKRWLQRVFGTKNIDSFHKALTGNHTNPIFDASKLIIQELTQNE